MVHATSVVKMVTRKMNAPTKVELENEKKKGILIAVKLSIKQLTVGNSNRTKTRGLMGIRLQEKKDFQVRTMMESVLIYFLWK